MSETSSADARDFTDLLVRTVVGGGTRTRVVGTTFGHGTGRICSRRGSRFNIQLEPNSPSSSIDQPG